MRHTVAFTCIVVTRLVGCVSLGFDTTSELCLFQFDAVRLVQRKEEQVPIPMKITMAGPHESPTAISRSDKNKHRHKQTRVVVEHSPGGFVYRREPGKRAYFDMHIPKTAGSSFANDVGQMLPSGEGYFSSERCLLDKPSDMVADDGEVVMFRRPRPHVYSQFLECKYDRDWSVSMVTHMPESNKSKFASFSTWLTHFNGGQERDDLGCYHPYNMQTRAMTCATTRADGMSRGCHHYEGTLTEGSLQTAVQNMQSMFFVGIAEQYEASLCLFHAKTNVGMALPEFCNCSAPVVTVMHVNTHGLPARDVRDLEQEDFELLDGMIQFDKILYYEAMQRFDREVADLERKWGMRIRCSREKTRKIIKVRKKPKWRISKSVAPVVARWKKWWKGLLVQSE